MVKLGRREYIIKFGVNILVTADCAYWLWQREFLRIHFTHTIIRFILPN